MKPPRSYPTDVSDEKWVFAALYLTLMEPQARQRKYDLRLMFNALRWMARVGAPWRLIPHESPLGGGLPTDSALAAGWLL